MASREHDGNDWPSIAHIRGQGYRVMFISTTDYGIQMYPIIFPRGKAVCDWFEPGLKSIDGPPSCTIHSRKGDRGFNTGAITRTSSCEIQYGPLNCDFVWKFRNSPILDESSLSEVIDCGMNIPSPDFLTPQRSAAAVWTWAPGYPRNISSNSQESFFCAFISSSDGRWRTSSCDNNGQSSIPLACRLQSMEPGIQTIWLLGNQSTGLCPDGSIFDLPRHPRENYELARILQKHGHSAAWLPLHGPDFEVQ